MFEAATNVRLLVRCPVCAECAEISRDQHEQAETYCSRDNVPMTVIGTAAGFFPDGYAWPRCQCRNDGRPATVPSNKTVTLPVLIRFRPRNVPELIGA